MKNYISHLSYELQVQIVKLYPLMAFFKKNSPARIFADVTAPAGKIRRCDILLFFRLCVHSPLWQGAFSTMWPTPDSDSEATITLDPIAASGGAVGYVLSDAGGDNDGLYKVVSTPEGKQFWILLKDDDLVDDEDESELARVGSFFQITFKICSCSCPI